MKNVQKRVTCWLSIREKLLGNFQPKRLEKSPTTYTSLTSYISDNLAQPDKGGSTFAGGKAPLKPALSRRASAIFTVDRPFVGLQRESMVSEAPVDTSMVNIPLFIGFHIHPRWCRISANNSRKRGSLGEVCVCVPCVFFLYVFV